MRMRHIVICGLPRSTILSPHYLINGTIFETFIDHKMYVLISTATYVWNIFHTYYQEEWSEIWSKMSSYLHVKYLLFFSIFNETGIFATVFLNITPLPNFMKIRPVRAELFHADGRTDGQPAMTKLIVAFRNFANAPKRAIMNLSKINVFYPMYKRRKLKIVWQTYEKFLFSLPDRLTP